MRRILLIFLLAVLVFFPVAFAVKQLMPLHGRVTQSGVSLSSGDLRVMIFDSSSGGNLVYDSNLDFVGSVSNGVVDAMLGSGSVVLDLNYGSYYYLDLNVNGVNLDFGGVDRKMFESNRGNDMNVLSVTTERGSIGAWSTNANALPLAMAQQSSVAANGYIYLIGGATAAAPGSAASLSAVYYAKINSDGSVGTWNTNANSLPAARIWQSSVVANGYIYAIGGFNNSGAAQTTVFYAKLNPNGSIGPWKTNANSLPAARVLPSSVVSNGYIYVIGGYDGGSGYVTTVYYAKLNSDGSIGSWLNGNSFPLGRYGHSSIVANGYVYVMGGGNGTSPYVYSNVYYAKLNSDGNVGAWATTTDMPIQSYTHISVVSNGYVYVFGGNNHDSNVGRKVYYSKLNSNGTIGSWSASNNMLPVTESLYESSGAIYNGYIYLFGGYDFISGNWVLKSSAVYASVARLKVAGNLDLLGLTAGSSSISDSSGDVGGSVYAGNIYSANRLEVSGNAQLWSGLAVNGPVTIFDVNNASSPMFSIVDSNNNPYLSVLSNGNIGVGASPGYRLDVNGQLRVYPVTGAAITSLFTSADGNVGIGTANPKNKLNVIGDLNVIPSATGVPSLYVKSSADGNVAVGGIIANQKLVVYGDINSTGLISNGAVYSLGGVLTNTNPSSMEYKSNIAPINLDAARILGLVPKSFTWKSNGKKDFGYIAEDVKKTLPEIYIDGSIKGYDISKLQFYSIELLKQQQNAISLLNEKTKAQQDKINRLESEVDALHESICRIAPRDEICKSG